jgi:hypothetical protein
MLSPPYPHSVVPGDRFADTCLREQNKYIGAMGTTPVYVEIQSWDWPLHVGVRPGPAVAEHGPEEDLLCMEAITIEGLVLSPEEHRSKLIHLILTPLPREIILGNREERTVGRLHKDPAERKDLGFYANLFLPADTLEKAILCLSSRWRSIHMWVDEDLEGGAVTDFGFSADIRLTPAV